MGRMSSAGERGSDGRATPAEVIRDAVPTSRHAQMLFDMVSARLGELAVVETANEQTHLTLYRREAADADAIIPWPLLRLGLRGRLSTVVVLAAPPGTPDEPPPRPGKAPKLRNLGPGEIELHDGPHKITVTYGKDGRWIETARSMDAEAHTGAIDAIAAGGAQPTELLATYVADLDLARHGPARVLRPAPLPGGVASAYNTGLFALRDALFDEHVPPDAAVAVADGFSGAALAWGETVEEALDGWRAVVRGEQPEPHIPEPPTEPEPDEVVRHEIGPGLFGATVSVRGPEPDVPWPDFVPANTPAVIVPLARCPYETNEWGTWTRLLGPHGETTFALVRRDLEGCTIVGAQLVPILDLETLEAQLDRADVLTSLPIAPRTDWPAHLPTLNSGTVTYQLVDDDTREPIEPRAVAGRQTHGFVTRELDGAALAWRVMRQRWFDA